MGHAPASFETGGAGTPFGLLLQDLDAVRRAEFLQRFQRLEIAAGEALIAYGDAVDSIYVVESGMLRAEVPDRHGLPLEVATLAAGDYCGEMAFLRPDRASATVRAVTAATVLAISHADFAAMSDQHPSILRRLGANVAGNLDRTNAQLRHLRAGSVAILTGVNADWPAAVAAAVADSAARHLVRPVLLLWLTPVATGGARRADLSPLPSLLDDPALLTEHDGTVLTVARCTGSPADLSHPRLLSLMAELRRRYGLVTVVLDRLAAAPPIGPLAKELAATVVELRPEQTERGAAPDRLLESGELVLLRRGKTPALPSALASWTRDYGRPVIRLIAGDPGPLDRRPSEDEEPWISIDALARRLIGKRVGVAFGAGGSKGYAHLGVIEQLRRLGVPVDFAAGCSIGAPIAAAVADGLPDADTKLALDSTFSKALRPTIPFNSFLSSRTLRRDLDRISRGRTFEELRGPLSIVAVDLAERREVVFNSGSVASAMLASIAIPGIFPPVRIGDRVLVDGGLLNPIPNATVAAMGADVVIGIKLTNPVSNQQRTRKRASPLRAPPIVDTILNAFEVMQWKIVTESAGRADITITPQFAGSTGLRDFVKGEEFIECGRAAAAEMRPLLQEHLPWVR